MTLREMDRFPASIWDVDFSGGKALPYGVDRGVSRRTVKPAADTVFEVALDG